MELVLESGAFSRERLVESDGEALLSGAAIHRHLQLLRALTQRQRLLLAAARLTSNLLQADAVFPPDDNLPPVPAVPKKKKNQPLRDGRSICRRRRALPPTKEPRPEKAGPSMQQNFNLPH